MTNYKPVTHQNFSDEVLVGTLDAHFCLAEEVDYFNRDTFYTVIMPYYRRLSGEMFFLVKSKDQYSYVKNYYYLSFSELYIIMVVWGVLTTINLRIELRGDDIIRGLNVPQSKSEGNL